MAVRIIGTQAGTRPDDAEVELIAQAVARYGRCTLLVPSIGERDVVRTALAEAGCGMGITALFAVAFAAIGLAAARSRPVQ